MDTSEESNKALALEKINKIPLPLSLKDYEKVFDMLQKKELSFDDLSEEFEDEYWKVHDRDLHEAQKRFGLGDYE